MKIVSCIKQVYDLDIVLENDWVVDDTQHAVDIHYANRIMNSYDEASLELMLQLKDNNKSIITKAITIGDKQTESILHKALAIGVDEALRVDAASDQIRNPFDNATLLYESVKNDESIDLILCGKQSDITNYGQTGQILAEKLHWPCFTNVFEIEHIDNEYHLSKLLKDGIESIVTKGPLVITTIPSPDKFLRMATLRDMLKAKKSVISTMPKETVSDFLSHSNKHYNSLELTIDKPIKKCIYIEKKTNTTMEQQLYNLICECKGVGDER